MSFILDFVKLALPGNSATAAISTDAEPATTANLMDRKRKSRSPPDIVPSIETDQAPPARRKGRTKRTKITQNSHAGLATLSLLENRIPIRIKEESINPEPCYGSFESKIGTNQGEPDNSFEESKATYCLDTSKENGEALNEKTPGGYIAAADPDSAGEAILNNRLPNSQVNYKKPATVAMPNTSDVTPSPLKRVKPLKPVDWGSPISIANRFALREVEIAEKTANWRLADAKLYRMLRLRGLQPALPPAWKRDFPCFPKAVFAESEASAPIKAKRLRPHGCPDFTAPQAFKQVFEATPTVLCALKFRKPPEKHIEKAIKWFIRWSLEDAGIRKWRPYLPLIVLQVASKHEPAEDTKTKLVTEMQKLKNRWSAALEDYADPSVPPLYGIMICHYIVTLVAPVDAKGFGADGHSAKDKLRVLQVLNFKDDYVDLWNAISISLLAVHCRDLLLETLGKGTLKGVEIKVDPRPGDL